MGEPGFRLAHFFSRRFKNKGFGHLAEAFVF